MTRRISPLARASVVVWMFCCDCVLAASAVCLCTCGEQRYGAAIVTAGKGLEDQQA